MPEGLVQRLQVPLSSLVSGRSAGSTFGSDGAIINSGKTRLVVRVQRATLEVAVRSKDEAATWSQLDLALSMVFDVLAKWSNLPFDVWAPLELASLHGSTRLFLVKDLWKQRRMGGEYISAGSSEDTSVLSSAEPKLESASQISASRHVEWEDEEVSLSLLLPPPGTESVECDFLTKKKATKASVGPQKRTTEERQDNAASDGFDVAEEDNATAASSDEDKQPDHPTPLSETVTKKLDQAEEIIDIAGVAIGATKTVLKFGTAIPVIGGVCQVAVDILNDVQALKDNAEDVIEAGRKVASVLEFLELLQNGALQQLAEDQKDKIQEKIEPLRVLLVDFRQLVRSFNEKGWLGKAWGVRRHVKTLAKLDRDITHLLKTLQDFYNLARDENMTRLLKERVYPLGAAMDEKIRQTANDRKISESKAVTKLTTDKTATGEVAAQGGVNSKILEAELQAISQKLDGLVSHQKAEDEARARVKQADLDAKKKKRAAAEAKRAVAEAALAAEVLAAEAVKAEEDAAQVAFDEANSLTDK